MVLDGHQLVTPGATGNTRARFEQWAQNPSCQANTISAVHNIRMSEVAIADGVKPTFGQSPFALARGENFEQSLFYNQGERILEGLIEKDVIPPEASGFLDLRLGMNRGPLASLETAINATSNLLREVATYSSVVPSVVAGATIRIPRGVMLPEAILILDVIAIRTDGTVPELIVGEVKTYPDRGGHTDASSLATARAQAGLYVHALELLVEQLDLGGQIAVSHLGFLVLTRPGSNRPSIRAGEDLRFQAERARRGFELLERSALGLPPFDPVGNDPIVAVQHAATDYSEACLSFCDRAAKCHLDALDAGNPAVLGDNVVRFLGEVDLHRAMELLDGSTPSGAAEEDLMRRIAESDRIAAR